jgi:hypothetical protein
MHELATRQRRASTAISEIMERAVAASLLASSTASAKDNKAKKAKKKARKKCKQQQGQCEEAIRTICSPVNAMATESVRAEGNGPSTCIQRLLSCCPFFATCNAREGVECLFQQRP